MSRSAPLDQLQQVHELNRAFLGLLHSRALEHRRCLELPVSVRPTVANAVEGLLDSVACFPRALFELQLGLRAQPQKVVDFDEAERELCLSILLAARSTTRYSAYQARFLFGLDARGLARLTAAPLADLQRVACIPGTLQCAFRERAWFWNGLLTATRPEVWRQLTLMALQPAIVPGWPQRRAPRPSA
jgi:hypothetical protein